MEISEEQLKAFITRSLKLLLEEEERRKAPKKKIAVILTGGYQPYLEEFFEKSIDGATQEIIGIVQEEDLKEQRFCYLVTKHCQKIVTKDQALEEPLFEEETYYPVLTREALAKMALCIPDCFESKWMEHCFEKGEELSIFSKGVAGFTGKEPAKFQERILSYLRSLLEYGIGCRNE